MTITRRLRLSGQSFTLLGLAVCAIAASTFAGCGSSSPSGSGAASGTPGSSTGSTGGAQSGSSGQAQSCGASAVAWKEDGVQHCSQTAEAIEGTTTAEDVLDGGRETITTLEVAIVQPNTAYIFSFSVSSVVSLDGAYDCSATSGAELVYDEVGGFTTTPASCNIVVSETPLGDGGMTVSGTFSATLAVTDGGTKMLTDGTFSLPVVMSH
jgi:hypothetical protein